MKTAQKIKNIAVLFLLWALPLATLPHVAARQLASANPKADLAVAENYGKLPLSFERNQGQSNEAVKFLSRGKGYTLFLTPTEAVLSLRNENNHTSTLRMQLVGANEHAQLHGQQQLEGKVNYLVGNDRNKWRTGIPTFRKVHYGDVWPGVDLVWYGTQSELEYDFIVKPGSAVSTVRFDFEGAESLRIDNHGNLLVNSNGEEVKHSAPVVYQEVSGERVSVAGRYVIKGTEIGFEVGNYDHTKPLVIDPVLIYSSYIGGEASDQGLTVATNVNGEAYVAGETGSVSLFPLQNPIQTEVQPPPVGFITKLNATGTNVLYSTFFGDSSGFCTQDICGTQIRGIAVTNDGKIAITGAVANHNNSTDLPVTDNAFQGNGFCINICSFTPSRKIDAFVSLLSADGSQLIYSTFFGGASGVAGFERGFDAANGIAIDLNSHIYIVGETESDDLAMRDGFQTSRSSSGSGKDAFIAVFNPLAARGNDTLLYSSYYGGEGDEVGRGIALDPQRNAYIVGSTASTDLPTKSPTSQPLQAGFQGGGFDGFVAKIDADATGAGSLTYSTYFGGNINDRVEAVAVDAFQRAYITGASNSSPTSFPLLNAFDSTQTNGEAFVAKLNADGTALFYSSFLGGNNTNTVADAEEGLNITLDFGGNAYVTGRTTSGAGFPSVFPLALNLQGTAFLAKIEASISTTTTPKLLYSTTFGGVGAKAEGIAIDPRGNVYLAGSTPGTLPTTSGIFDATFNGGDKDAFIAKFSSTFNETIGTFRPSTNQFSLRDSNSAGAPERVITFGQPGDQPIVGDWNGNGVDKPGVFRPSTGQFLLQFSTLNIVVVNFGQAGDLAVVGDWDGNGTDTPGVFTPATGQWRLTAGFKGQNVNGDTPVANFIFNFGGNGDLPIAGDWDGNGKDSPGFYTIANSTFVLSNNFVGTVDFPTFIFGNINTRPIAGDWNGDGVDTVGVYNQQTSTIAVNNTLVGGNGEIVFVFGQTGDAPLAGDWDGKPTRP